MQEAVTERIEKEEADKQWQDYEESNAKTGKLEKPSEKQKSYIISLGRRVGLKINIERVQDREAASRLIEQLRTLRGRVNGNGYQQSNVLRDRQIAFGMATKLVYRKWIDLHHNPRKSKRFWDEVTELFGEYEKHQETALSGFVSASELAA